MLVENYKVKDLKRHGLSHEDLEGRQSHPDLLPVTGYGQDGPYARSPAMTPHLPGRGVA